MNVAILAPGGESDSPRGLSTTIASDETPYTDSFQGTASAASQVAGAVALLLDKNPSLGYRDVKEVLMRSAAGGLLNVAGALALAEDWINLGPLQSVHTSNNATWIIPDNPSTPLIRNLDLYGGQPLRVEHVELTVSIRHPRRGDLSFTIVSPSGMRSLAAARPNDDGADFENFTFTSVRHWGETSTGMWKVMITDTTANGAAGELVDLHLRVYGTSPVR
jgi:subtilisin-like proprotein convertase family protein